MKNIAVICALPPERNTGMVTVDLSAHVVLPKIAPDAEIIHYTLGKLGPYAYAPDELPFQYHDIHDHLDEFLKADCWVYWGDFVHSQSYWTHDRGSWNAEATDASLAAQKKLAHDFIFLKSLPDADLKKAIIFGSTIITNDASIAKDAEYTALSQRLFGGAGAVYFREALSAAYISPLRPGEPTLACDCALLLENDDLKLLGDVKFPATRKNIGVFFGRSRNKLGMLLFTKLTAKKLGLNCGWIPWFPTRRKLRLLAKPFGFTIKGGHASNAEIFSQLAGYELVITDTYHLCVNAWRMGIPAICIGEGTSVSSHSLNDKKKEILFEMYGAREFYVFSESLRFGRAFVESIEQVAKAYADKPLVEAVRQTIGAHRTMARRRLSQSLAAILSTK